MKQTWTILELLNWTADYFRDAGLRNPRLNAEVLLGHVLGLERIMLYARFEQAVSADDRQRFREVVKRRAAREPLQYLVGSCEFWSRRFEVTPAVMVPRQETELLVEQCLSRLPEGEGRAADVCTGPGVIAVTLAAERPEFRISATDVSEAALAVAARNARAHGVEGRVDLLLGDLVEPIAPAEPGFDLIAANPPYIPTARIEELEPEVRDHEPRRALDGGADGLAVIRRLVPAAAPLLSPGGWLVLEMGERQAAEVGQMLSGTDGFDAGTVATIQDPSGCERVLCARKKT